MKPIFSILQDAGGSSSCCFMYPCDTHLMRDRLNLAEAMFRQSRKAPTLKNAENNR